ncbi:hypothetical protein GGR44_001041 [Sphingobium fontiphilum]|uniref:Uncharacterized protein n=1 Tax=Sphingobium fontiphilum TaxID=944425 RepID=A0A7W6GPV1_9SPHN|nr:hypothetical protein [Sphingobium fontiphilum]
MFAQFVDGGMIVVLDRIWQGQVERIENPRLATEELEQARCFLNGQT